MKLFKQVLSVTALSMLVATTAHAAGNSYIGAKISKIDTGHSELEKPMAYGVYGGYNFNQTTGIEADYTKTEGLKVKGTDVGNAKLSLTSVYGTYRMPIPNQKNIYAKGKLGATFVTSDVEDSNIEGRVAWGAGVGINLANNISMEAEYSKVGTIEEDGYDDWKIGQFQIASHFRF